jgi:hypothetical protein
MTHTFTHEQEAIFVATVKGGNLMLNAYAGCGKTSTLEALSPLAEQKPALGIPPNETRAAGHGEIDIVGLRACGLQVRNKVGHGRAMAMSK